MSIIKELELYVKDVFIKSGYDIDKVTFEYSSRPDLGDFQINDCMSIAKKYSKNPRDIANEIINNFDNRFKNVNIAGPGFINVTIDNEYLAKKINPLINNFDLFIDEKSNKKIIVDYGGANAAKTLHVGHMRSANIGSALYNLSKVFGNETISDVHLGDFGRQAGMLISEYKLMNPTSVFFDENYNGEYPKIELTDKDLGVMYPKASIAANEDENRMNEVRFITSEIDKGNKAYLTLWKQMVDISSSSIKKVYDKLNCKFDLWEGELDSIKYIDDTLKIMNPYLYESQGALVCDVDKESDNKPMPPLLVIKSDGSSIYATRDLATIYSRVKRFNPDEIWYVVDQRQGLYFEQVFRASYKTGLLSSDKKIYHYGFGTINGKDGKPYKTRDGGVLPLEELLNLVKNELLSKINKYDSEEEKNEIADTLTIATIKYADLLPYRTTDYVFDIEKFCSFEGKTGPYVLYTLVRIQSILNKLDIDSNEIKNINSDTEKAIYLKVMEISRILTNSYNERSLSYICEYLYEICSLFNKFYGETNIINEQDIKKKKDYIALLHLIYNTSYKLLAILGIDIPSKM